MSAPSFQAVQTAFAAHIRDPENVPAPANTEARRIKIYQDLFYNNIEGLLSNAFPVLRATTADNRWHHLIRRFFADYPSHEPIFHRVAGEFLQYLGGDYAGLETDPAWYYELAHYEWVELALMTADDDQPLPELDAAGDLLSDHPVVSTLAWPLAYQYPVHQIAPEQQVEPAATYLLVYRNIDDDVKFMEINAITARLLQILTENPQIAGESALRQLATEMGEPNSAKLITLGLPLLKNLQQKNIIRGTMPAK